MVWKIFFALHKLDVSSVEAFLSRQHELPESTKDNIRSRVTCTLKSASLPNSNYNDKMDWLVNDKQTYEVIKRDPTPVLQHKRNNKLLSYTEENRQDRLPTLQQTKV